jgi:hypothetical protein
VGAAVSRAGRLWAAASPAAARVEALRRERWSGHRIAQHTGLGWATVSRILRRLKLSRMRDLEPKPPLQCYEHARAGDLLHLDIKKLGRIVRPSHRVTGDRRDSVEGAGWEYVHVAIDDHSRIAFSAIYSDEKQASVLAFLRAALAYYARLGIQFKALLTDNVLTRERKDREKRRSLSIPYGMCLTTTVPPSGFHEQGLSVRP